MAPRLYSQEFKLCHEERSGRGGGSRDRKVTALPKLSGCEVRPSEAENSLTLIVFGLLAAAALTTGKIKPPLSFLFKTDTLRLVSLSTR